MTDAPLDKRTRRIMWIGVLPALVLPLIGTIIYTTQPREESITGIVYGATKLAALLWVPVFALLEGWRPRPTLRHWRRHLRAVPLGLATGAAIGALFWACFLWTPLGDAVRAQEAPLRDFTERLGIVRHYVVWCVFICIAHSLWEEFYWRWYAFGRLNALTRRPWLAAAIGSAAFASHHYVVLRCYFGFGLAALCTLGVAVGGALWCWMLLRQRTLVGAWVSHGIVDAAFLAIGYVVLGL